ncbi:MAG: hypothetical protein Q9184_003364 [Pyrenodesmia sp. 2 TL-2023]
MADSPPYSTPSRFEQSGRLADGIDGKEDGQIWQVLSLGCRRGHEKLAGDSCGDAGSLDISVVHGRLWVEGIATKRAFMGVDVQGRGFSGRDEEGSSGGRTPNASSIGSRISVPDHEKAKNRIVNSHLARSGCKPPSSTQRSSDESSNPPFQPLQGGRLLSFLGRRE